MHTRQMRSLYCTQHPRSRQAMLCYSRYSLGRSWTQCHACGLRQLQAPTASVPPC